MAIFVIAYALVIGEEFLHMRKSKPVAIAAGVIWALVAIAYIQNGNTHTVEEAVRHNILEYAELLLFLLAAMGCINIVDPAQKTLACKSKKRYYSANFPRAI